MSGRSVRTRRRQTRRSRDGGSGQCPAPRHRRARAGRPAARRHRHRPGGRRSDRGVARGDRRLRGAVPVLGDASARAVVTRCGHRRRADDAVAPARASR
ncbi:hypothetical protein MMON44395_14485 [Mycolicibacterium monacense DSM 44395]|nr:hypothetical protein [Mycolicibacterium monacense DSM 44395]